MEEDKKVIAHYFGYSNYKTFAEDEQIKKSMGTLSKSIVNIINELERLQKEFEAVDHECSRLEQKEIILENALNFEKTVQNSKLKYLINSNLEKTEDGEYIVDSNACQTLVRHLIRIVDNEEYDVTCLHCGNDTPLYCEKCQQELISKNAELQMRYEKINKFLHSNSFVFQNENGDIQGMLLTPENFIPKQVLRNRIADLEEVKSKYNFLIGTSYRADGAINTLKEILGDE